MQTKGNHIVNKESFNKLLELQSCQQKIAEYRKEIISEEERVSFVQKNIDKALIEIEDQKEQLNQKRKNASQYEDEISDLQKKLERTMRNAKAAKNEAQSNAAEKEIKILNPLIEEKETLLMKEWEEIEEIEREVDEKINYKKGSKNSLEKIKSETRKTSLDIEKRISSVQQRKFELYCDLGESTSKIFKQIDSIKQPAVTFMDDNSCSSCFTQLDQGQVAEVNALRSISFCPTCGRILVSLDVRF